MKVIAFRIVRKFGDLTKNGTPSKSARIQLVGEDNTSVYATVFEGDKASLKAELAPILGKKASDGASTEVGVEETQSIVDGAIVKDYIYRPSDVVNPDEVDI